MSEQLAKTMNTLGTVFNEAFRQRDLKLALSLDLWSRNFHRPEPSGDRAVCPCCKVEWPCDDFQRIDARVSDLRERIDT